MACKFEISHAQQVSGGKIVGIEKPHCTHSFVLFCFFFSFLTLTSCVSSGLNFDKMRNAAILREIFFLCGNETYLRKRWVLPRPKRHRRHHFPQHIRMVHHHGRLVLVRCEVLIGHRFASPSSGSGFQVLSCHFYAKRLMAPDRHAPNRRNWQRHQHERPD